MRIYKSLASIIGIVTFAVLTQSCTSSAAPTPKKSVITKPLDFAQPQTFLFSGHQTFDHNHHQVDPQQVYSTSLGYGFDLSTTINKSEKPFYFSIQVPPGNYRVSITFGDESVASSNTVKAESRRLYVQNLITAPGEFVTKNFIVNVRQPTLTPPEKNAPGGVRVLLKDKEKNRLHWDDKLTLEINGDTPRIRSLTLQKVTVPTVYLVGDSTVTDQPYEPAASWGQMLPLFFNDNIAVANHAESGETMKSFLTSLRFAKVLETLTQGDYLFIQFGHNDQKKQWPQTYVEANTTYQDYLKVFIAEAQLRGATPVLITSMQRRTFNSEGKIQNSHGDYPQAVRNLATQMNLPLIDLDTMSVTLYESLGIHDAPKAFNDNGKDATHHNNYGAYQLAQCVIEGIRQNQLPLTQALKPELPRYSALKPDALTDFKLQASPLFSHERPDGQ